MSYNNVDGLYVLTGVDEGTVVYQGTATGAITRNLVIDIPDFTLIGTAFGASNINVQLPTIPANAVLTSATLVMTTAATSAGAATLSIGTYNAAGTAIVAAGITSATALTAIDAIGEVVRCAGTQVAGTATIGTAAAYIGMTYATAAYTAGAAKLFIQYLQF